MSKVQSIPESPTDFKLISEIEGFEIFTGYAVDKSGNVISCRKYPYTWYPVKPKIINYSYPFVNLSSNGVRRTITNHRLVGLAFIPNPESLRDINHKNGIKQDNRVENLEWVSHSDNLKHAIANNLRDTARGVQLSNTFLTEHQVSDIFTRKLRGETNTSIAIYYDIDRSLVSNIWRGKTWRHVTDSLRATTDGDN